MEIDNIGFLMIDYNISYDFCYVIYIINFNVNI